MKIMPILNSKYHFQTLEELINWIRSYIVTLRHLTHWLAALVLEKYGDVGKMVKTTQTLLHNPRRISDTPTHYETREESQTLLHTMKHAKNLRQSTTLHNLRRI